MELPRWPCGVVEDIKSKREQLTRQNKILTAREVPRFAFIEEGVIDSYLEGERELQKDGAMEPP